MAAEMSALKIVNSRWLPKSPDFKWSKQDGNQKPHLRYPWLVFECHL